MASVKYHGEYPEGQDTITQHGYEFEQGKSVNVTDKDLLARFASNRFFEVSGESDKDQVEQGKQDAENAEAQTLRAYLDAHQEPYRANASLANLRQAKEAYDARVAKAQEG